MFANELHDLARERSSIYAISKEESSKIVLSNILRSAACGNYHYYFHDCGIEDKLKDLGYDVTRSSCIGYAPYCSWIFKDLPAEKIATFYNGNQKLFDNLFESMKNDACSAKFIGDYEIPEELRSRVEENLRIRGFAVFGCVGKITVSWMNV